MFGACVSPPTDLRYCKLPSGAKVPQAYATTQVDRELQSFFSFLKAQNALPTPACAQAYLEFQCSQGYPICRSDGAGQDRTVNTCYFECSNFVSACAGQLIGVARPNCGQYSVSPDCTARLLALQQNTDNGNSASTVVASLAVVLVALVAAL